MIDSRALFNRRHVIAGLGASALLGIADRRALAEDAAEIPIGMVLPFSGATGPYGPDMKKAADIVVKVINDGGGILGGRKLHLFIEDSETNPTVGVTATRKLLDVNKVELVGGFLGQPDRAGGETADPRRQQGADGVRRGQRHHRWRHQGPGLSVPGQEQPVGARGCEGDDIG